MLSMLLLLSLAPAIVSQEVAPTAVPDSSAPPSVTPGSVTPGSVTPIDPSVWTTPGSRIPDVELPRVDGQGLVRLSDYEGKRLLLLQFASW
ncbi:hypothetical protein Poly30_44550 [Planctomycetes bacterium Poly30]|uniref:Alkyl hydroperoxide reductase subunit C/ Thiol specific antioxidant domain-containing protein n=1 Tax=Saltatorellus ferox TaxID=2528018 RepID=A0A518EXT8_9BACT|nr:hypothetical protein Poly30_44550 [Planctomycetes bacterium Poly30]